MPAKPLNTHSAVQERYSSAAKASEPKLCCPINYDQKYLEAIPQEVVEKDYGCGDPSKYLKPGETVLDLGSGTGKICFIAAQVVGREGRVIGVDMTDDMLEVARRNAPVVAEKIGYSNVTFLKGRIQDLALDLEMFDAALKKNPITNATSFLAAEELAQDLSHHYPLISNGSVDVVVSNCVLNLVAASSKKQLFGEIFRVLKMGGRAVISDIVCDEVVPEHLQNDPELWSGCISGALTEEGFIEAFEDAGFYGVEILSFEQEPWQTVEGIEFRSMTIQAFKGEGGPGLERNQAVIYKGPFKEVLDDHGHCMQRGVRHAVCDKTYALYRTAPYAQYFDFLDPLVEITPEEAAPYDPGREFRRDPRETKGEGYDESSESASECCSGGNCC